MKLSKTQYRFVLAAAAGMFVLATMSQIPRLAFHEASDRATMETINLSLLRQTFRRRTQKLDRLGDGCHHVFLDVGANIGVHGRFLLEPEKYPNATKAKWVFDRAFGSPGNRDNRDFCVFEFEPNPRQREKIQKKVDAYEAMGWRYEFLNVAASDNYGTMSFSHNHDVAQEEWGFSIKQLKTTTTNHEEVPTIRLADWIRDHIEERDLPGTIYGKYKDNKPVVVMKMDIEGSEYVVLPDMITSGAICTVDVAFGEMHPKFAPIDFPKTEATEKQEAAKAYKVKDFESAYNYGKAMVQVINESRNCKTLFRFLDDEVYLHDGMPLPTPEGASK